ncbi:MAG: hypothetical protein VX509_04075 [Verrucomicrobiota bacterium]|nr:hypothetical protein [Verrucomicrobiota bacterium]
MAWSWRAALGREPGREELDVAGSFLGETRQRYEADPKAAKELLAGGLLQLPPGWATREAAAWTVLGQALLNLSETITRN